MTHPADIATVIRRLDRIVELLEAQSQTRERVTYTDWPPEPERGPEAEEVSTPESRAALASAWTVGDSVQIYVSGELEHGEIIRIEDDRVTVRTDKGQTWIRKRDNLLLPGHQTGPSEPSNPAGGSAALVPQELQVDEENEIYLALVPTAAATSPEATRRLAQVLIDNLHVRRVQITRMPPSV